MKVSGVAIGQWNQLCRKKEGIRRTSYKIMRAVVLGKVTLKFKGSNDYIVRYHDLNILVNRMGMVLTVWRDTTAEWFTVRDAIKRVYDVETTHKQNMENAKRRHLLILKKGKEVNENVQKNRGENQISA